MSGPKRVSLFWLVVIMLVAAIIAWDISLGQDNDNHGHGQAHHDDDGTTSVDVSTQLANEIAGDSIRSFAVVSGLGNAAINNCVVTTQWGIPIIFVRQGFREDHWCQAMALLRAGFRSTALLKFCRDTSIGELYDDEKKCLKEMVQFIPNEDKSDKVENTRYVQQQEENKYLREELAMVTERIEQRQAIPPSRAVSANTAVIQDIQKREAERVVKEESAKAYFRKKYETAIAKEQPDEGT